MKQDNKKIYTIKSHDTYATGSRYDEKVPDSLVPDKERLTAGIPTTIEIGHGSRVMLRRNQSLADGKFNHNS